MPHRHTFLAFVLAAGAASGDEPKTVQLGGPRKAEARVSATDAEYRIDVKMLRVRAFDQALNDRLNREKARQYGLQALARYLSGKDTAEFTISGARVTDAGLDGAYFMASLRVPRDGVRQISTEHPGPDVGSRPGREPGERVTFSSELFTRKGDLERTLDHLLRFFLADVRQAERGAERFDHAIADIEEQAVRAIAAYRTDVKSEKLLLEVEAEELLARAGKAEEQVLDRLKDAVARREAGKAKDRSEVPDAVQKKFQAVEVEKPFDTYLFANLLLMETAGAKVIRLPDGGRVIVAVASVALKDDTAKTRLDAEKVCRAKALASVVAEKEGVQVFRLERLEEKTVVETVGDKETAKSVSELLQVTKTKVEGWARDMSVVGRWRSKDGDVLYLVIGAVYDKHGDPVTPKP